MGLFKNLMGGLLGFGLGGPIGVIIGVLVVNVFSSGKNGVDYRTINNPTPEEEQNRFIFSLLVLIAVVLKADGTVKKSELPYVKAFLLQSFGEKKAKEALQMLKEILKQDIDAGAVSKQLSMMLTYSIRLELLHMLFRVANADNEIVEEELKAVERIASDLNITQLDFNSIKSMFGDVKKSDWAYDVLEIEKTATDDEVKVAYRKMAMKYHPDKVGHLGEDVRRSSEEKFKQVKNAYDHILEIRKK